MSTQSLPDTITYRQAVDLIAAAADNLLLPFPYGIDEVPGTGVLAVSFWTDLDVQSWSGFFGASAWDGARSTVIVHAHDWHGWTVQMTGKGVVTPVITGTPAEVSAQIGQHFGAAANKDECDRLNAETDAPVPHGPVDPRVHYVPTDLRPRGHEAPAAASDRTPVPIVEVLIDDPDLHDVGRGDPGMARIGVPIDLTQTSFGEAAERLADWHAEVTPTDAEVARLARALVVTE